MLLAVVLRTGGVERADNWASVLAAGVAIAMGIAAILTSWSRRRAATAAPVTPKALTEAVEDLKSRVHEQWKQEAEAR